MNVVRIVIISLAVVAAVTGCSAEKPQSTVSRNLDSGVTANNGGGMAPANFGSTAPLKVQ